MCRESAWKRVQVLWDPVLHGMLEWYWCRENVWTGWYIKGLWKWRREICSEFCLQVCRLWWVWNVNFTDRPFTDVCFLLCLLLVIFVWALSRTTAEARRTETIFCLSAAPSSSTAVNYLACYLNSLQNRRSVDSSLCSSCKTLSQAFAVKWFRWRIQDEQSSFRLGPRDRQMIDRGEMSRPRKTAK